MFNSNLRIKDLYADSDFYLLKNSELEKYILHPYKATSWNVYGIIWTGSDVYKHEFNGEIHTFPKNHFLFISPHIQNAFVKEEFPDAVLFLFNSVFFARSTREAYILQCSPLFHRADEISYYKNCLYASDDLRKFTSKILRDAIREKKESLYSDLAHSILSIIILFGMTQLEKAKKEKPQDSVITETNDFGLALDFRALVFENYKKERSVAFYAKKLNVSSRDLTNACKKAFNKTAKELITSIVFEGASRLLSNSDLSVKEITYDLGFTEETNFIAFFRKLAGITPHNFRKRYNKHRLFSRL